MSASSHGTGSRPTLAELAQASEALAQRLLVGTATTADLDTLLGWRQSVLDALPRPSQARLTAEDLDAVRRIGDVDEMLWNWCRQHQAELRAQLRSHRARKHATPPSVPARILSQEA